MKDVHGDLVSLAAVLAVPLVFAMAFPREAIGFFAVSDSGDHVAAPSASFVFLDSDAVARVMQATRILSRHDGGGTSGGVDLLVAELSDSDAGPMMPIALRRRPGVSEVIEGGIPPFVPSRRAAPPLRISAEKDGDGLPFPRSDLLKLN